MWINNYNKNNNTIELSEIHKANDIVKDVINKTPLFKLNNISNLIRKSVYYKDESKQVTSSFKGRGVYYCVFNKLKDIKRNNVYIVTQSTGNHGIATLHSLWYLMKKTKNNYIKTVIPIIFASKNIQKIKLNKMKFYLTEIRKLVNDENYGDIRCNYESYEEALSKRIEFVNKNVPKLHI